MVRIFLVFILIVISSHSTAKEKIDYNQDIWITQYTRNSLRLLRNGPGSNHVIQGIALDQKNSFIYTLHVTGNPENGVINRFSYTDDNSATATAIQLPSNLIGHQGISVNPQDGNLYSSAGSAVENRGWHITHFTFKPNSKPINLTILKVFGDGYNKTTNSMPTFTPDGKHLIVRGKKGIKNILRIYNMKEQSYERDLSSASYTEWSLDPILTSGGYYLQAITADNKYIYLLSGKDDLLPKRILIYDLNGKLININNDVVIGLDIAKASGTEQHWEPEGMAYDINNKNLLIAFSVGDKGNRKAVIFFVSMRKF